MKNTLFPEWEQEIRDDRKADRRERVQHARHYLKARDLRWLINRLIDKGPATEHTLLLEAMEEEYHIEPASRNAMNVLYDLHALWTVGKLWRRSIGIHPGSGEESFIWGVKGVHERK